LQYLVGLLVTEEYAMRKEIVNVNHHKHVRVWDGNVELMDGISAKSWTADRVDVASVVMSLLTNANRILKQVVLLPLLHPQILQPYPPFAQESLEKVIADPKTKSIYE
jgi:hypothetical protein